MTREPFGTAHDKETCVLNPRGNDTTPHTHLAYPTPSLLSFGGRSRVGHLRKTPATGRPPAGLSTQRRTLALPPRVQALDRRRSSLQHGDSTGQRGRMMLGWKPLEPLATSTCEVRDTRSTTAHLHAHAQRTTHISTTNKHHTFFRFLP